MRLNRAQMETALGLLATRASGLKSQFGTMGKPFNAGLSAADGVEAATLARLGIEARLGALEGPQGFGPTHHGEGRAEALDGLGEVWRFESVSHSFMPVATGCTRCWRRRRRSTPRRTGLPRSGSRPIRAG
ncbi:MAG: MmgE/PrpD family protein [Paracoccaceae bacterium]